jgi:pimeloyl-ACP methyl ester carboxylesterase
MYSIHKVDVNDHELCYLDNENRKGKTLFFVHGWGADKSNLKSIYDQFTLNFRVISVDLPGFGESFVPEKTMGSTDYAAYIFKLIKLLDLREIVYIGHSFGGKIGIVLSHDYPGVIEKLVLINSSGLRAKRNIIWYIRVYSFKFMKKFYSSVLKDHDRILELKEKFGSTDYKNAGSMRDILVKTVSEDFSGYLPGIKCPVFLYWGDRDRDTPLWMAKKMNRLIPDSGLYIVKGGGHFSFVDDNRIIPILDSFVRT